MNLPAFVTYRVALFSPPHASGKAMVTIGRGVGQPYGISESEFLADRAEEIATSRLSNDDDLATALCDALTAGSLDPSAGELTNKLGERSQRLMTLFRTRDFVAFAELLAESVIADTADAAQAIAEDEWARQYDRPSSAKTARAA